MPLVTHVFHTHQRIQNGHVVSTDPVQDVRTLIMTIQEQLWRLVLYQPYLPNVHIL